MPDGATLRDHYTIVARSGRHVPELDPLPAPPACGDLLDAYWQMRQAAGSNGMGPNSITYEALAAWQNVFGARLSPWEIETLLALDSAALTAIREQQNNGNNGR